MRSVGNKIGILVSSIIIILLVGCAIFIIAAMHNKGVDEKKDTNNKKNSTTSSVKAVTIVCQPTEYKDVCHKTLEPLANDSKATLRDYILASIRSAKLHVDKVLKASFNQSLDNVNTHDRVRVEECKKLLSFAMEDLESSIVMLGNTNNRTLGEHVKDLQNWLTAVYSFQSQCKHAINNTDEKFKSPILDFMLNSTQFTGNALAIASGLADIIKDLSIDRITLGLNDINLHHSRRLLDATNYPTWFPAADRKLFSSEEQQKPDVVVAKDGSGKFKTIGEAVAAYRTPPPPGKNRYIIYVKAGVYNEQVIIQRHQDNVFIYGDGNATIVTCDKSVVKHKLDTPNTATFAAEGKGFMAKSMTFRNTAGPEGEQAVALRVQSEGAVVYQCRIEGYQDTLLYQNYRQFYRDCVITGTVDFIFGEGTTVIQNSQILVRKPSKNQDTLVIVADGNEKSYMIGGLVLHNCTVKMDNDLETDVDKEIYKIYLGRPWMPAAKMAIIESDLGGFLNPEGYVPWPQAQNEKTCKFFEYKNRGPGASLENRVKWSSLSILKDDVQAQPYTVATFIDGEPWLQQSGAPFRLGLVGS